MRALFGTAAHFCKVVVLNLGTLPIGAALSLRILQVIRRGAQATYKRGAAVIPLVGHVDESLFLLGRQVARRLHGAGPGAHQLRVKSSTSCKVINFV